MPYDAFDRDGKWCVYKLDGDHNTTGDPLGCHDDKAGAVEQMRALYASEQPQDKPVSKGYIAPRPVNIWERVTGRRKQGVSVYKAADGSRYMFIVTSNSYRDREREFITTSALKNYVERSWLADDICETNNVLLFWHDGPPIGEIVWTDMEGPFLLEVAKEYKSPVARKTWDYIEAHPEQHWGASHGFHYTVKQLAPDGEATYTEIDKFETSVLPLKNAANPYTFSGVIMSEERDKLLEKMGLPVKALRQGVQSAKAKLDEQGVEHKSADETALKGIMENLSSAVDTFVAKLTDAPTPGLKDELMASIVQALATGADTTEDATDPADAAETDMGMPEDDPMMKAVEVEKRKKELALFDSLVSTQESLVKDFTELNDAVKALTPLNELAAAFKGLTDRLERVEKQLGGRPRAASEAPETVVEAGAATVEVQKQMAEHSKFWGVALKGK